MHDATHLLSMTWFLGAHLWAAGSDLARYRIPNAIVVVLLGGYVVATALSQSGWTDIWPSLAASAAVLAGGAILFARRLMGGGDVKLLAVSALWLGPAATPALLLLTAVAGGVLALALVLARTLAPARGPQARIAVLSDPQARVPYAIAIAAAAAAVALQGPAPLFG